MTQLGIGVAALNHDSTFQAAYEKGMKKSEYWVHTLEDSINLVARLPALAARIYRNVYRPGTPIPVIDKNLDLVGALHSLVRHDDSPSLRISNRKLHQPFRLRGEPRLDRVSATLHCPSW
jgi:citrate synthase